MTQTEALNILKTGGNVFLTGEPGSGKTHTVNEYVSFLRSRGVEPAITASTGIAATHIGGRTIHSWSGIGVRRFLSERDLDDIAQNKSVVKRVANARVLIIDEVSMLSARTFAMADAVCREIRRSREPFGGLQTVLVGDFFQLPPVNRREGNEDGQELFEAGNDSGQFAFMSLTWRALNPLVCYLSEQHRQEDHKFLDFLSAVRRGIAGERERVLLRTRYARTAGEGITQLYSHNEDVNKINENELAKLAGEARTFEMQSRGPATIVAALKRGCLSPEVLALKTGARVMFTKNDIERKYVNGTLAAVTGFRKEDGLPVVKTRGGRTIAAEPDEWRLEDGGRVLARITQIPLRLAWAMTVHKSQGMSLDAAHMDLSDTFEYGQGYVALSRVRTLQGLSLAGLNRRALEVHPDIIAKDGEFRAASSKARETFAGLSRAELETMHRNFIRACGGKAEGNLPSLKSENSTYDETLALVPRRLSLKDMARERGVTVGTIVGHLEKLAAEKKLEPLRDLAHIKRDKARFADIKKAFAAVYAKERKMPLAPARALLGDAYSYDELRIARLFLTGGEL